MYTARVARVQCVLTAELFTTRCGMAGSYAFACENTYEVLDFVGTNRNNMIESSSSLIILYLIMQIRRSQIWNIWTRATQAVTNQLVSVIIQNSADPCRFYFRDARLSPSGLALAADLKIEFLLGGRDV